MSTSPPGQQARREEPDRRLQQPGLGDLTHQPHPGRQSRAGNLLVPHRSNLPAARDTGQFSGPPTSAQMMGLRHLEYIADVQGTALDTALVPLREGRRGAVAALLRERERLLSFAAIGLLVFLAGLALQVLLIRLFGLGNVPSYIIKTLLSVQLSFVLSRYITWRDRSVSFGGALIRFNVQQLTATGLGVAMYAGLERFGMNYIAANVAVTAVLTPVSFVLGHRWSMADRAAYRVSIRDLPWPLFAILAIQALFALRLIWVNSAYTDEALYIYSGSQELNHWVHGTVVQDYQNYFSGSPAVYPPLAAIANSIGGLVAARLLSLGFMLGTTSLLYATTSRLLGRRAAALGAALFAAMGTTQFLSAFATYDPMALFLLVLSAYLVVGRKHAYDTLTDVAYSTVIAAAALALANADKYATGLWDPAVVALACLAPVAQGYPWRYGLGRALRFVVTLGTFLALGLAVGKHKYIIGILTTTVNRSKEQIGMGQPASTVLHDAWGWVGLVLVIALAGLLLLFLPRNPAALRVMGVVLMLAAVAAPLNQARIGTSVSLQKHVVFGAWFGCILAGYALSRILRNRALAGVGLLCLTLIAPIAFSRQSAGLYQTWQRENPAFIAGLRPLLQRGTDKFLIEGHSAITAYYIGPSISSIQWKDEDGFAYSDPRTGAILTGDPAFADAIQHRAVTLIILDMVDKHDRTIAGYLEKYGGYQFVTHLPPDTYGSTNYYTVWRVAGKK